MHRILVLAALLSVPCSPAAQQLDVAAAKHIDSVFAAFATTHSPGCAVAVTRGTQVIFARGYGMASLELNVPITPRTVMDGSRSLRHWMPGSSITRTLAT